MCVIQKFEGSACADVLIMTVFACRPRMRSCINSTNILCAAQYFLRYNIGTRYSLRGAGETPLLYHSYHGSIDEHFTCKEEVFVVTAQPPVTTQPTKRALDYPSAGQYHEPYSIFGSLDYL